jgi:hypothetical protein
MDTCVAGGLPFEEDVHECVVRECAEEASIPAEIASTAHCASYISYHIDQPQGVYIDFDWTYDCVIPADFKPTPCDGEVAGFQCLSFDEALEAVVVPDAFMPSAALTIIDVLVRHGHISPAEDSGKYLELVGLLRLPPLSPIRGATGGGTTEGEAGLFQQWVGQ